MKIATVNKDLYRYEIHALIKAFYPEEDVKVFVFADSPEGELPGSADSLSAELRNYIKEHGGDPKRDAALFLCVHYGENGLTVRAAGRCFAPLPEELPESFSGSFDRKSPALGTALKHMLYRLLSELTGAVLPWGELIGIRPTKLAMEALSDGASREEAAFRMMREHRVSREKAELAADIAVREREILSRIRCEDGYSLYIGIPFCPTTCLYCSFTSFPLAAWSGAVDDYLDALEREIRETSRIMRGRQLPDTVYIGGGTPTTLEPAQMDRLLRVIRECFPLEGLLEFTCEAGRPDSITRDKLRVLKNHGVSRISVNPQTMNDRTLRLIGRQHDAEQTVRAFYEAREAGFDNINMDIILGLPEETEGDVRHTVREIGRLAPDDLTVHSLALKRSSRMQEWIERNGFRAIRNTDETMRIAAEGAARMGLVPYYLYRQKNMSGNFENVGYAKPGNGREPARYGIYNILIMEERQTILALGAGAITKRVFADGRIERCENAKDVTTYMENIGEMIKRKRRLFEEEWIRPE
ncbi:coproporphyrinogen dehydrogenase HemZ [Lachnoclostridium sp. Marseille-P6806]|uniref:coproporphyrinogen dehydrogenase HemZ n=1 Tax=Lachnoclostridium sp. Marseille-P6806 TaxID=2364793 RepID=UPI001030DCE8|nr:coproporphyrinogen dehydrogenase HemZ [Lachnoclostridium sp. Marseille-P6806]